MSSMIPSTGSYEGLGFVVTSNLARRPGDELTVTVLRDGEKTDLTAVLLEE